MVFFILLLFDGNMVKTENEFCPALSRKPKTALYKNSYKNIIK